MTISRLSIRLFRMSPFTLMLLDHGFYGFHLALTLFNVFGWMFARTRRAHRWCVGLTAACWLTIGPLLYGTLGYCPLTDWHWQIKEARGQIALPDSFITLLLNQIGLFPAPETVEVLTGVTFAGVIAVTLFLWRRERKADTIAKAQRREASL